MAFSVPTFGNATNTFYVNEDNYNTASTNELLSGKVVSNSAKVMGGSLGNLTSRFSAQDVVIGCPSKNTRVCALISEPIKINGQSDWADLFGGGIMSMSGNVVDTVNNLLGFFGGVSLQQPWMDRQMWKKSKPLEFTIPMNFVAENDCLEEVVKPYLSLLSYAYPRIIGDKNAKAFVDEKLGDYAPAENSIIGASLNAMQLYRVPGPSVGTGILGDGTEVPIGDNVFLVIGKMIRLTRCYVTNVSVETSNVFDNNGYPLWAKCTVTVKAIDSNYCKENGSLSLSSGFSEGGVKIDKLMDTSKQAFIEVGKSAMNVMKSLGTFYSGGKL